LRRFENEFHCPGGVDAKREIHLFGIFGQVEQEKSGEAIVFHRE
jgi:hypothetical protein